MLPTTQEFPVEQAEAAPDTALIPTQSLTPAAVFAPGSIDRLLDGIAQKVRAHQSDVTTAKGRAAIASLAMKVARSKTFLDDAGKTLVADWKTQASAVDAERRRVRDFLDSLKAEVRQPLTAWEEAEEAKAAALQARIGAIRDMGLGVFRSSAEIAARIDEVRALIIGEEFRVHQGSAALAKDAALTNLDGMLRHQQAQEAVEAERIAEAARAEAERAAQAEREAAERAAREQQEAAERVAREAEEARIRAKRAAEEEAQRAEREQQAEARRAVDMAHLQELAEADAKRREQEAAERERARIEREIAAITAAAAKRAADQEHRRTFNREALDAIVKLGVSPEQARAIVLAIVSGEIPHVSIGY